MKKISLYIFITLLHFQMYGQKLALTEDLIKSTKGINNEFVWITTNNTTLFPSEYLYFNLYCLNHSRNKTTDLSRVGYVSLRDAENKTILSKRIEISDGLGQGELFIPPTLKTGSYLLVGYTQWMLNFPTDQLFSQEIYIINPYTNAKAPLTNHLENLASNDTPISTTSRFKMKHRDSYAKREAVEIVIETPKNPDENFPFSVSVRKVNSLKSPVSKMPHSSQKTSIPLKDSLWIPEHRGAFLKGHFTTMYSDSSEVFLSSVGAHQMVQKIAPYKGGAFTIVHSNLTDEYKRILQDDTPYLKEEGVEFSPLPLPEKMEWKTTFTPLKKEDKTAIVTRSLYNQIENNYLEFKPDSLVLNLQSNFLNHLKSIHYDLNEYTRFASIKETLKEITTQVMVDKVLNDEVIKIKNQYPNPTYQPALLIYDGILIPNAKQLFSYDARDIDEISIYAYPIVLGGKTYNGALLFKGNNPNAPYLNRGTVVPNHLLLAAKKNYFKQSHSTNSTLPDYRMQLFWNPLVSSKSPEIKMQFYTSDVTGQFEIRIQGVDSKGFPYTEIQLFEVRD